MQKAKVKSKKTCPERSEGHALSEAKGLALGKAEGLGVKRYLLFVAGEAEECRCMCESKHSIHQSFRTPSEG